jgi:hypothetical protein
MDDLLSKKGEGEAYFSFKFFPFSDNHFQPRLDLLPDFFPLALLVFQAIEVSQLLSVLVAPPFENL